MVVLASSVSAGTGIIIPITTNSLLHSPHQQLYKHTTLPTTRITSPPPSISLSTTAGFRRTSSFRTAVVAADTSQPRSSSDKDQTSQKYYFVVANAKFMLDEEEHFKELLFERVCNFKERNKEQDFWLVIEPKFLDKFPNITKRLKRPAVALVSTNGPWITYMKLRLDRVLAESYEANSLEEALASNPTEIEFDKPEKWVAPYSKYEYGWWKPLLPPGSQTSET